MKLYLSSSNTKGKKAGIGDDSEIDLMINYKNTKIAAGKIKTVPAGISVYFTTFNDEPQCVDDFIETKDQTHKGEICHICYKGTDNGVQPCNTCNS